MSDHDDWPILERPEAEPRAETLEKAKGIICEWKRVFSGWAEHNLPAGVQANIEQRIFVALTESEAARASAEKALLEEQAIRHQALEDSAEFAGQRDEWARRYEAILGKHIDSGWAMAWQHVKDADARVAEITQQREEAPAIAATTVERFNANAFWPVNDPADRDLLRRLILAALRALPSAPPAEHKLSDRYPLPWTPAAVAEANAVIAAEHPAPPARPIKCSCRGCFAEVDPRAGECEQCANGDHSYHAVKSAAPPATPETPPNYWREPWWHQDCGTPHGPADPCPLPAPATPETPEPCEHQRSKRGDWCVICGATGTQIPELLRPAPETAEPAKEKA